MNRPMYETDNDQRHEQQVIERLCQAWKADCQKLPIKYIVDYGMLRNQQVAAWLEIKCRNKKYDEMILSAGKWFAGKDLAKHTSLPFILVYAFPDSEIRHLKVEQHMNPPIRFEGRTDRHDWQDREPCVILPLDWFKTLR